MASAPEFQVHIIKLYLRTVSMTFHPQQYIRPFYFESLKARGQPISTPSLLSVSPAKRSEHTKAAIVFGDTGGTSASRSISCALLEVRVATMNYFNDTLWISKYAHLTSEACGTEAIFLKWLWLVVGGEFVWSFNGLIPQPQPASVPFSAGPLY